MLPDQPRLMIVDDDPVTCEMLCEVFAAEGFAARFVQSGEAAVSLLADEPLDVLVSDIRMKTPFDGLALLDHVRQQYPHLPVVLMTAFGSVDTAVRAVKQGAFDYVSKPFDIDALVATVRRALAVRSIVQPGRLPNDEVQYAPGLVGPAPAVLGEYESIARGFD